MTQRDKIRRRLLDVAAEAFGERGFEGVTIREICRKAEANIAAVNYHFGDKEKLYQAVIADLAGRAIAREAGVPAEEQLRRFVRGLLRDLLGSGASSRFARILVREMSQPSAAFDAMLEQSIRPMQAELHEILRQLIGDRPPRTIAKCAVSILGQVFQYHYVRPTLKRLSPIYADLDQHVEELTDHITRFSLSGIDKLRR